MEQDAPGYTYMALDGVENCIAALKDIENGKIIYYGQSPVSENMSLSIDNEEESFTEINIHEHKGYAAEEAEYSHIIWADGISLYTLSSNTSLDELIDFAESIE